MILMKTYLLWSTLFICEWLVEKYTSLISVSMYHFMHKRYIYHWIACVSPEYSLQKYAGINISFTVYYFVWKVDSIEIMEVSGLWAQNADQF